MKAIIKSLRSEFITIGIVSLLVLIMHFLFHGNKVLNFSYSIFYLDESFSIGSILTTAIAFAVFLYSIKVFVLSKGSREKLTYLAFSVVFLAFGFEEAFSFRDELNTFIKENIEFLSSAANFSWIISLGIFVVVFFAFIIYSAIKETKLVKLSMLGGVLCLLGVVILEIIGGRLYGVSDTYIVAVGIEEFLEMLGLAFFLNGLALKLDLLKK